MQIFCKANRPKFLVLVFDFFFDTDYLIDYFNHLEDKNPAASGYKLADHVDKGKELVSEAVK